MKKYILHWTLGIAASLILSTGLLAQEQVDVSIKVKKDGKVIMDTTYQFDDASEAKHAMMMLEAHSGSGHSKAMVFISEDGETTEIKEFHGDSLTWVSEGEEGPHKHGKKVIVIKSDDGNTFDILVDEDGEEHVNVKKKEIKVMVSSDEEGNWTVVEGDDEEVSNVKVIVIKEHDEDHDEDFDHDEDVEVEVEVIKKEKKK